MADQRKICFPITSRAYYGRSQILIRKLHAHPTIDLKLMLGGSILLDKYSRHVADDIAAGGFDIEASLFNVIEGGNHVAMAKTAAEPPGTAGSQFFVVTGDDAGLPPEYAIVGKVTDGLDVVDRIGALGDPDTEQPLRPVVVDSVTVASNA